MFFYVCVVFYTQSLVLMLQYHISTTKHSTVSLFIQHVLLCVCCILHSITCTNVTISHINNQTFYRFLVYTVCSFMCSLYFTHNHLNKCYNITYQQPNILPFSCLYYMFFYVFVVFYTQLLVLMLQYHISTTKHSTVLLFIRHVLLCVCCILHSITCTNVTISHINNQTFYRSLV
jgi:ABC-type siderophore export system fused ATPase/permease subunit